MTRILVLSLAMIAASLSPGPAVRAQPAASKAEVAIGYVELTDDVRYANHGAYAGIVYRSLGRPRPGAELGIEDAATLGRVIGTDFHLVVAEKGSVADLAAEISRWTREEDVHFVIADLPEAELLALADAVRSEEVSLLNISSAEDDLRGADCRPNVLHVAPSESMLTDALVQYLVTRDWRDLLVLRGPSEADASRVEALERSAAKFGATVVGVLPMVLGTDPRDREQNNVALMTAGIEADVVFVADGSGEIARYVPYQTSEPIPVVGDAGLMPVAWHWSWYRHGAPQLQHRFETLVEPRRMNGEAWAAWAAVKAVTQAALRSDRSDYQAMRDFLLSERLNLDGSKGSAMSFRSWDHQLRQPILLATADATIARAPLAPFLHRTDVLDTLGADQGESQCRF